MTSSTRNNQAQTDWTPEALQVVSEELERSSPREVLQWGIRNFAPDLALATGFGPSGVVLMHLISSLKPETPVFYLDTDLYFPETYALKDQIEQRFGIRFTVVPASLSLDAQENLYGPALWEREPDKCCFLRKVLPLRHFLSTKKAWVSGIRRDQAASRAGTGIVEWDSANRLVKLNPLANWTSADVWSYVRTYDLPYNQLHDQGYPSVGCIPCTAPVAPGEDERSGRWRGHQKTECGIHLKLQL